LSIDANLNVIIKQLGQGKELLEPIRKRMLSLARLQNKNRKTHAK